MASSAKWERPVCERIVWTDEAPATPGFTAREWLLVACLHVVRLRDLFDHLQVL